MLEVSRCGFYRTNRKFAHYRAQFIRDHLMVEVTPTRAFAIIERADEFSTRATRWVFD